MALLAQNWQKSLPKDQTIVTDGQLQLRDCPKMSSFLALVYGRDMFAILGFPQLCIRKYIHSPQQEVINNFQNCVSFSKFFNCVSGGREGVNEL